LRMNGKAQKTLPAVTTIRGAASDDIPRITAPTPFVTVWRYYQAGT
jgi:hypothetical protein